MLRAGRRARNVPVCIDEVISSVVHGRGCVGEVTHTIGWIATERRYVEGRELGTTSRERGLYVGPGSRRAAVQCIHTTSNSSAEASIPRGGGE